MFLIICVVCPVSCLFKADFGNEMKLSANQVQALFFVGYLYFK